MAKARSGAETLVSLLREAGVECLFGLIGTTVMDVLEALRREGRIRYYGVRHESAAAHMADGYARASGRVGVCISHVGPGALHLLYGVATAHKDSTPLLAITGNEASPNLGRDSHHEVDVLRLFEPATKWRAQALRPSDLPRLVRNALLQAVGGRPGAVLLDLPKDVARARWEEKPDSRDGLAGLGLGEGGLSLPAYRPAPEAHLVERARESIERAERPLLVAGGGVTFSGGEEELRGLADRAGVLVVSTEAGRGCLPEDHPLWGGILGRAVGDDAAHAALAEADCVVGLGLTFSDRTTLDWTLLSPGATLIQVDLRPEELGRQMPAELRVMADAKLFLAALREGWRGGPHPSSPWGRALRGRLGKEREAFFRVGRPRMGTIKPQLAIRDVIDLAGREAIIGMGSGLTDYFITKVPVYRPRAFLSSSGMGSMGFCFPAVLGAKVACPERPAIALMGDGDFMMSLSEVETAARYGIPAVAIVLNNFGFGSQRLHQRRLYGGAYIGTDHGNPDFGALARLFGAEGRRVDRQEDFRPALEEALRSEGPTVLDLLIDPEELPRHWHHGSESTWRPETESAARPARSPAR